MTLAPVSIAIALVFAPLASAMAYLITYAEYVHHYPDKKRPRRLAAQAAAVTLVFFLLLSAAVGFLLGSIVSQ
jgi:hypothetical protein